MLKGGDMEKDNVPCYKCKHLQEYPFDHKKRRRLFSVIFGVCTRYPHPQMDKSRMDSCGESEPR